MSNARITAIKALNKIESDSAYSNIVLNNVLSVSDLSALDKAFSSALFYGVLERRITLDYILSDYLKKPIDKMDLSVQNILRCGIYQLKFMDKVPDRAAVNESVKCCTALHRHSAKGLVNAVLRSFIRDNKPLRLPKDENKRLSVEYSIPTSLVQSYIDDYGRDTAASIMDGFLKNNELCIRVNTKKISTNEYITELINRGVSAEKSPLCENAVLISSSGDVTSLFGYKEGYFHIQDAASQLCVAALDIGKNDTVLDVCAAPGGKAFTAAEYTNASVTACDLYPHKIRLIKDGASRLGLDNIIALENDASKFNSDFGKFDRILCDLPCSGFGILGKKPEIRYKNVTFVDKLPEIQYDLLVKSSNYLKSGGLLVYSTCTLRHAENRAVADKFLAENPDFEAVPVLPEIKRGIDEPQNQLTLLPHIHHTDGFFISLFKKVR